MTSKESIQIERVSNLHLTQGSNYLDAYASSGMTGNFNFIYPYTLGATGNILTSQNFSGDTEWTNPSTITTYPPTPRNDYYRCRTNQIISINVIGGVSGNSGGVDILGGSLTAPTNAITSINILQNTHRGTLTATGGTGAYTYQSYPRTTGKDWFIYSIVDSAGVTSKNTGVCEIDIVASEVINTATGNSGPYFAYCDVTLGFIYYYRNGTSTTLTQATFGGLTAPGTQINSLATNRDDNLIYYVSNAGGVQGRNIYAYDYVNNIQFLVANATTNPLFTFFEAGGVSWSGRGGVYNSKILYMPCANNSTDIYKIVLGPYITDGVTGSQEVLQVTRIVVAATMLGGDFAWNYRNKTLIRVSTNTTRIRHFCPTSFFIYREVSYTPPAGTAQFTSSYDNTIYMGNDANTTFYAINVFAGQETSRGTLLTSVTDVAEWINEAV